MRRLDRKFWTAMLCVLPWTAPLSVAAQEQVHDLSIRIENWTDQPFQYQVGRAAGPTWSEVYTLEPKMTQRWGPIAPGQSPALATLTSRFTPGALFVRYPLYDGLRYQKLTTWNPRSTDPAETRRTIKVFWYLLDRNGRGALYQRPEPTEHELERLGQDREAWYEQRRQELLTALHNADEVPTETPETIRNQKFILQSNHAYLPW